MADGTNIASIGAVDGDRSMTRSLQAYSQWLSSQGHTPVGEAVPNHPGEILGKIAEQAGSLSNAFGEFKAETSKLMDEKAIEHAVGELRDERHPGPARAEMAETREVKSGDARIDGAAASIREAAAFAVERQMRQTVALLHHDLSMQVLRSSIEASITSGKQVQDGFDMILRG